MQDLEKIKKYFLVSTSLILLVGIIMVYSSSYILSKEYFGTSTHFLFKQMLFLMIGSFIAFIISKTKMYFWFRNIYVLNGLMTFLLLLTTTPLGKTIKGSKRWLDFQVFSFQPGELIKYTLCLTAIYYFHKYFQYTVKQRLLGTLHFFIPLTLLVLQPDFGTFSISAILILFACFLSDFPRKIFYSIFVLGGVSMAGILVSAPYRVKRLMAFMDPWSDAQNSGFQIIQSYLAFANGHIFGQGIGNSNEKLFYLPEAHNDFIFSVIGEEVGFLGVLFIVLLFLSFTLFGFKLAMMAKSKLNQQMIACLVFSISMQAFLNMGVVLGLLPTKGLNLPMISYGGTSLMANLIALGFVFCCISDKSQIEEIPQGEYKYN
jgi:cell division protein FtsW